MRITCPTLKPRLPTGWPGLFANLEGVVVDEWHELMGTKRGVQTELAVNWLKTYRPQVQLWGISATLGNMDEAKRALGLPSGAITIKADLRKDVRVHTLLPDHIDQFPWAGHIGLKLRDRVADIVRSSTSTLLFTNTRSMTEILDSAALQQALRQEHLESRGALNKPLDVLVQFITTLSTGVGCSPEQTLDAVRSTHTYRSLTRDEWDWAVWFLTTGGQVLQHYDEYARVQRADDGTLHVVDRRTAMRHRLSIGTITSDTSLSVKFLKGGRIGSVEESFIARLRPGDVFLFAGRYLEFVRLKDLTVLVRKSGATTGAVSRWMGGRMQLSSRLAGHIRAVLERLALGNHTGASPEEAALMPLLHKQAERSHLPAAHELLIEQIRTREGWHHFFYPIDGRAVHEGLASLIAWRISQRMPISFSIAMNDYGFELLSDQPVPQEVLCDTALFTEENLDEDIRKGINASEMAKRQFREIARVAGLVFQGFPGRQLQNRHLQANSGNHDILQHRDYEEAGIRLLDPVTVLGPLRLVHEPPNGETAADGVYTLCGHLHPGIRLEGKGRQRMTVPCFLFGEYTGVLPAFGGFTGLHVIRPCSTDRIYVPVAESAESGGKGSVLAINQSRKP